MLALNQHVKGIQLCPVHSKVRVLQFVRVDLVSMFLQILPGISVVHKFKSIALFVFCYAIDTTMLPGINQGCVAEGCVCTIRKPVHKTKSCYIFVLCKLSFFVSSISS